MEQTPREHVWCWKQQQQIFSQSFLWDLQRNYFTQRGVEAWQQGEVPHYITSNPTIARSYAEIVFAFWRDSQRLAPESRDEPLFICELGAGSGRFAFHFLLWLTRLCEQTHVSPTSFRYVLTDLAERNLQFWHRHPRFQPFFQSGMLDIGFFDLTSSDHLVLRLSGHVLAPGSVMNPLVVIANYVFDSIPQDLFYLDEQNCSHCLVSLFVDKDPATITSTEPLNHVSVAHYEYQAMTQNPYQEPFLQELLTEYQRTLTKTHLLFPAPGLRCLQRLQAWSQEGLLLLSADKGDDHLAALEGRPAPEVVHHGSFSLSVNYHAFKSFCEYYGGLALFPERYHASIMVGCLLLLNQATAYRETQHAYQRSVQEFGPDDFYCIVTHARHYISKMSVEEILAYLRLSYYDSHQFARYVPHLQELAPTFDQDVHQEVMAAIERVWEMYFPLGEAVDLASRIASLLYGMNEYQGALTYFERSTELYGQHTDILYKRAVCHQLLGQYEQAEQLLRTIVQHDPENQVAQTLLAEYLARESQESENEGM